MLPQLPSVHDVPLGSVLERVDERIAVEQGVRPGLLVEPLEGEAGRDETEDGVVREEGRGGLAGDTQGESPGVLVVRTHHVLEQGAERVLEGLASDEAILVPTDVDDLHFCLQTFARYIRIGWNTFN